jgi:hypothetical protein
MNGGKWRALIGSGFLWDAFVVRHEVEITGKLVSLEEKLFSILRYIVS